MYLLVKSYKRWCIMVKHFTLYLCLTIGTDRMPVQRCQWGECHNTSRKTHPEAEKMKNIKYFSFPNPIKDEQSLELCKEWIKSCGRRIVLTAERHLAFRCSVFITFTGDNHKTLGIIDGIQITVDNTIMT